MSHRIQVTAPAKAYSTVDVIKTRVHPVRGGQGAPPAPIDVVVQVDINDPTHVSISWTDICHNCDAIIIERTIGAVPNDFVQIAQLSPSATSYEDTDADFDSPQFYRVRTKENGILSAI